MANYQRLSKTTTEGTNASIIQQPNLTDEVMSVLNTMSVGAVEIMTMSVGAVEIMSLLNTMSVGSVEIMSLLNTMSVGAVELTSLLNMMSVGAVELIPLLFSRSVGTVEDMLMTMSVVSVDVVTSSFKSISVGHCTNCN